MSFPSYNDGFNAGREFVKPELDSLKEKLAASQARVAELDEYESLYAQARYALDAAREEARQAQARVQAAEVRMRELSDERGAALVKLAASEAACERLRAALREAVERDDMSHVNALLRVIALKRAVREALAATPPAPEPRDAPLWCDDDCALPEGHTGSCSKDVDAYGNPRCIAPDCGGACLDAPAPTIAAQPPQCIATAGHDGPHLFARDDYPAARDGDARCPAAQPPSTEPPRREGIDAKGHAAVVECVRRWSASTEPPKAEPEAPGDPCATPLGHVRWLHEGLAEGGRTVTLLDLEELADTIRSAPQPTTGDPRAAIAEAMRAEAKSRPQSIAIEKRINAWADRIASWPLPPGTADVPRALELLRELDAALVAKLGFRSPFNDTIAAAIAALEGAK